MITKTSLSSSWVEPPTLADLPAGVHHISDVMPAVLDPYGLSLELEQNPDAERLVPSSDPFGLFDVMIAGLEEALAT